MQKFKKLVNRSEQHRLQELEALSSEFGYRIWVKVRVADVLPIESKSMDGNLFSFALKSHFDFTVTNDAMIPQFAVEFDGPSHGGKLQQNRDSKKDLLCEAFDFPLLRINSNHLIKKYNQRSLLHWVISVWELQNGFAEAQRNGHVPPDEDFDPLSFFHPRRTIEDIHPHWISLRYRLNMKKLYGAGRIRTSGSNGCVFYDERDNYHGIEWIDVEENKIIHVESAMRSQRFPLYFGVLFDEILFILLYEKLSAYLENGKGAVEPQIVEKRLEAYRSQYKAGGAHFCGSSVQYEWRFQ